MAEIAVKTNTTRDSIVEATGPLMPARAFFFIIVEVPGKDGFLVRKIYASRTSPYLANMGLSPVTQLSELYPEKYGLSPKAWGSTTSVAEHVMGNNLSPYVSTSSIFPQGSPRFDGRSVFIDVAKARSAGAQLISTSDILASLQQYKASNPHLAKRIDKFAEYVKSVDHEVLVKGQKVPASAVFTQSSLATANFFGTTGRVVQVVGVVLTAYDLSVATGQSFQAKSVKPISAEVIRQSGGWGGAVAGFKVGGVAGAALGIETGPGAIVTGLVGGIIFGAAGYLGADWVADHIYKN